MGIENPTDLYTAAQLLDGYKPDDEFGFISSWDFGVFREYVGDGAATPRTVAIRRRQAEHDAFMADALRRFLDQQKPKLVGIMGGHSLKRSDPAYIAVVHLARRLTNEGFLVVSGGGPGAMEAAHVGASFAQSSDAALKAALDLLATRPKLPELNRIVTDDGQIAPGREGDIKDARLWMNAALDAKKLAPSDPPFSLAVPTWLYGQEPTIPFATHYAKYFQNSIREETLIQNSRAGIVYARGGGGTVREIFEDAEQNYYVPDTQAFTPMIFFDPDHFWERDATFDAAGTVITPGYKVDQTITQLFRVARQKTATECLKKILFSTDADAIVSLLRAHAGTAQKNLLFALASRPFDVSTAMLSRVAEGHSLEPDVIE